MPDEQATRKDTWLWREFSMNPSQYTQAVLKGCVDGRFLIIAKLSGPRQQASLQVQIVVI